MSDSRTSGLNCEKKQRIKFSKPIKATLGVVMCLLAVFTFAAITNFDGSHSVVNGNSEFVGVQIVPQSIFTGSIGVNQTLSFFANVTEGIDGEARYKWTAQDLEGNFTDYEIVWAGASCNFRFLSATEDIFSLKCTVEDWVNDIFDGQGSSSIIIRDPFTSAQIHLDALPSTASYIIEGDSLGWYRVINCTSGEVPYSSTNASATIQFAIDNLTVGRSWKETIILKGNLGNVSNVMLSDYINIVGINAKMQLPSGQGYIFKQDKARLDSVEIQGIDFISATPSKGTAIFLFYFATSGYGYAYDVDIHDCKFVRFEFGIYSIAERIRIFNNDFLANNYACAPVYGRQVTVENNHFFIGDPTGAINDVGLYIIDVVQANIVSNFFVPSGIGLGGTNYRGIWLEAYSRNININLNNFGDISNAPILIGAISRSETGAITDITINNNQFTANENSTRAAIYLGPVDPVKDVIIENNIVRNYADLLVLGTAGRNVANIRIKVAENQVNAGVNGFQLYGDAYQIVFNDNAFYSLTANPIVGTGTLITKDNIGYP